MGRMLLGIVSGLVLGLAIAVDLQQFGVRPLDTLSTVGLPLLGAGLGLGLGRWRPLRRRA